MEHIMKAQALCTTSMSSYMALKKTLKLNPCNPIIKELKKVTEDNVDNSVHDLTYLLFETALLSSGFVLEEPTSVAKCIYHMLSLSLDVDKEEAPAPQSTEAEAPPQLETAVSSVMLQM